MGLGGFVDGIVLHQILQWHHMLSQVDRYSLTSLSNLQINVLADGLFHATTWIIVVIGLAWFYRSARQLGSMGPWRRVFGWMAIGWGAFNLIEGLIDHHVFRIHRVNPGSSVPLLWDVGFLLFGALLIASGLLLQKDRRARAHNRPT